MILKVSGFENGIDFDKDINVIEIEEKKLFRKFLTEINDTIKNQEENEKIILTEDSKSIKLSNKCLIIFDIFNIDYNSKVILNKLYSKLEDIFKNDNKIDKSYDLIIKSLLDFIKEKMNDFSFDYEIDDNINFKEVLKLVSLKIDYSKLYLPEEKIMFLIDLISEFELAEILIFSNIKNYFEDEIIQEIYKYAIYKRVKILLIENIIQDYKLKYENKIVIDNNFDESMIINKNILSK